jgi:hypothetical protein
MNKGQTLLQQNIKPGSRPFAQKKLEVQIYELSVIFDNDILTATLCLFVAGMLTSQRGHIIIRAVFGLRQQSAVPTSAD